MAIIKGFSIKIVQRKAKKEKKRVLRTFIELFPRFHGSGNRFEKGVGFEKPGAPSFQPLRRPLLELSGQMTRFIPKLAPGDGQGPAPGAGIFDFPTLKGIAPSMRFLPNFQEIPADGLAGGRMRLETVQLGMVAVPFGSSGEDLLGQEALAPKG